MRSFRAASKFLIFEQGPHLFIFHWDPKRVHMYLVLTETTGCREREYSVSLSLCLCLLAETERGSQKDRAETGGQEEGEGAGWPVFVQGDAH